MTLVHSKARTHWILPIAFITSLTSFIVSVYLVPYAITIKPKINLCKSIKHIDNDTTRYIFNLAHWRQIIADDRMFFRGDRTLWCDVPDELRLISMVICQFYEIHNCTRLPCRMIYSSSATLEDFKCTHDGRIVREHDNNDDSTQNHSNILCKRGYSLDLFIKKRSDYLYPSIIADPLSPLSDDLYIRVLNNKYRSCSSMWGFIFNYESVSYYSSTGDRTKLKLFDATFGYDRSLYDFTPTPWLFNYIEHIKFTSVRLTMEQAIQSKIPIYPETTSDIYWNNVPPNLIKQKKTMNMSYVRAPIVWMNSNCKALSKRTEYMRTLMKYIDVDNYGKCGGNIRRLSEHMVLNNKDVKDVNRYKGGAGKMVMTSEYLFTIAIENSLTYDYISEKIWQPLVAGSVPIYLGAPNIQDWLPCRTNCIIDLRKFKTPKDAAKFIKSVAMNQTLYESYHQWRNEPVTPKFQRMLDYFARISNYSLECVLCSMSRRVGQGEDAKEIKNKIIEAIGRF